MKWILSIALMVIGFVVMSMSKGLYGTYAGAFIVFIGVLTMRSARKGMTDRILEKAAQRAARKP